MSKFLYEDWMTDCKLMNKTAVSDGIGGFVHEWAEGPDFKAAIVKDNTLQAKVAEKEGVTEIYTVTFSKSLSLNFHDVFKRVEDGATFRITSNVKDSTTPKRATFQFGQASAERWELA